MKHNVNHGDATPHSDHSLREPTGRNMLTDSLQLLTLWILRTHTSLLPTSDWAEQECQCWLFLGISSLVLLHQLTLCFLKTVLGSEGLHLQCFLSALLSQMSDQHGRKRVGLGYTFFLLFSPEAFSPISVLHIESHLLLVGSKAHTTLTIELDT